MTMQTIKSSTQDQNPPSSPGDQHSGIRNYRLTAVCLGLLTVLLLIIITALSIHYSGVLHDTMEKHSTLPEILNQLQTNYSSLTAERDELQTNYSSLTAERDQLQTNYSSLTAERDELLTNYSSLKAERHELLTNYSNLKAESHELLTNYNAVTAERDELLRNLDSCPQGWIKFSSSCYYISNDRKTWNESRQNCREREADLVIINNKEKQMFISKFHNFWIGLTDSNKEGNWKWVDGTTLITGYWIDGQPDNEDNEDCVVTYGQKNPEATWNDLTCSCTAHWLCEKPASR